MTAYNWDEKGGKTHLYPHVLSFPVAVYTSTTATILLGVDGWTSKINYFEIAFYRSCHEKEASNLEIVMIWGGFCFPHPVVHTLLVLQILSRPIPPSEARRRKVGRKWGINIFSVVVVVPPLRTRERESDQSEFHHGGMDEETDFGNGYKMD